SCRFSGGGKTLESLGTANSSSSTEPRMTVFSTSGRAERPSSKKSEGQSGRSAGCLAMSCFRLHPTSNNSDAAVQMRSAVFGSEALIIFHLVDVRGVEPLQKMD